MTSYSKGDRPPGVMNAHYRPTVPQRAGMFRGGRLSSSINNLSIASGPRISPSLRKRSTSMCPSGKNSISQCSPGTTASTIRAPRTTVSRYQMFAASRRSTRPRACASGSSVMSSPINVDWAPRGPVLPRLWVLVGLSRLGWLPPGRHGNRLIRPACQIATPPRGSARLTEHRSDPQNRNRARRPCTVESVWWAILDSNQ
jgi:hypothetical protein